MGGLLGREIMERFYEAVGDILARADNRNQFHQTFDSADRTPLSSGQAGGIFEGRDQTQAVGDRPRFGKPGPTAGARHGKIAAPTDG